MSLTVLRSEANDAAIQMARAYTGHYDVVVFEDGFHGSLGEWINPGYKLYPRNQLVMLAGANKARLTRGKLYSQLRCTCSFPDLGASKQVTQINVKYKIFTSNADF